MATVLGTTSTGGKLWLTQDSTWVPEARFASEFPIPEAERRVRIINTNNRFLDAEDRIVAEILESR